MIATCSDNLRGFPHIVGVDERHEPATSASNAKIARGTMTNYPLGSAFAPCPSDLLVRGDLVKAIGGFEEHFTGPRQMYEDQAFLAKLYLEAPVYFSSKVWLNYRQHPESCVATVKRDGRYDEVRQYFLVWFEAYLRTRGTRSSAPVRRRLRQAMWPYRHPRLHLFVMPCANLIGRLRRKVRLVLANGQS